MPRRRLANNEASPSADHDRFVAGRNMAYRRNRTLTGSSSPHVASSNELDAELRSPRAHVHHLSKLRNRIVRRLAVVLVVAALLYGFMSQFTATVALANTSTAAQQADAYIATINSYYQSHPFERFRPALNIDDLLRHVQVQHPEISSLTLEHSGEVGKGLVDLTMRKPVARWVIGDKTELVDAGGVVFGYTPHKKPAVEIVDRNTASVAATDGNLVASHRFLSFVGQVVGESNKQGYTVKKVTIPLLTTRQLELSIKGVSYPVKLTIDRTAGEQIEDAARVIAHLQRKHIRPQYVDVRIAGKAFYK